MSYKIYFLSERLRDKLAIPGVKFRKLKKRKRRKLKKILEVEVKDV